MAMAEMAVFAWMEEEEEDNNKFQDSRFKMTLLIPREIKSTRLKRRKNLFCYYAR